MLIETHSLNLPDLIFVNLYFDDNFVSITRVIAVWKINVAYLGQKIK